MSSTGGPILYAAWIFFAPEPWSRWAGHIWSMPSRMETRWPLRTLVSSHIWEGTWVRNILGIPWVCHKGCFGFLLVSLNFGESGFPDDFLDLWDFMRVLSIWWSHKFLPPRTVYPRFLSEPCPERVAVKAPKPLGKQEVSCADGCPNAKAGRDPKWPIFSMVIRPRCP